MLALVFITTGCSGTININKKQIELMPRSVALKIFASHGLKDWADNPYFNNVLPGPFCNEKIRYIKFSDIKGAYYSEPRKRFSFALYGMHDFARNFTFCYGVGYTIDNVSEQQAHELVAAAVTMGARIRIIDKVVLGQSY